MTNIEFLNKEISEKLEALADNYCGLLSKKMKNESIELSETIKFFSNIYKTIDKNNELELESLLNELKGV